ncbi:hypothetical protein K438DRAFT_1768279 [Mycena galopus ATCC 62051]|nr:hypothetical protein K438DRAFT_1768279 [Mycena galopus ATCC 62051]
MAQISARSNLAVSGYQKAVPKVSELLPSLEVALTVWDSDFCQHSIFYGFKLGLVVLYNTLIYRGFSSYTLFRSKVEAYLVKITHLCPSESILNSASQNIEPKTSCGHYPPSTVAKSSTFWITHVTVAVRMLKFWDGRKTVLCGRKISEANGSDKCIREKWAGTRQTACRDARAAGQVILARHCQRAPEQPEVVRGNYEDPKKFPVMLHNVDARDLMDGIWKDIL